MGKRAATRDRDRAPGGPLPPSRAPASPRNAASIPFGKRPWVLFGLVGLVTFAVHLPSLRNGFVDWDDGKNLLDNLAYRGLGPEQLRWMWTTFHLGPYQPLSWMTYGLDYLVWGMEPKGYHLTSVILHAIAAALAAAVSARLFLLGTGRAPAGANVSTGADVRRSPASPGAGRESQTRRESQTQREGQTREDAALRTDAVAAPSSTLRTAAAFGALAALVWSIHPLRVEAVSWATERREVLCGVFSMLTILVHLAGGRWFVTALAALAAMLSKGTAVVLPPLLVLIDAYAAAPASGRELLDASIRAIRRHGALFGLAAVFSVLAVVGQKQAEAVATLQHVAVLDRLLLFAHSLGFYALKTVWPSGLAPLYEMSSDLSRVRLWGAVSAAVLAAVAATAVVRVVKLARSSNADVIPSRSLATATATATAAARRRPLALLLLLAATVVLLAPVGGLFQVGTQIAADRYAYASGWALSLMAAGAVWWALGRAGRPSPAALLTAAAFIGLPLGWLSVRQQRIWRDSESLWTHQLAVRPDTATAHYSLALGRVTRERSREADLWAEPHFREAIRIQPSRPEAYRGLGGVLRRSGRVEEAIRVYEDGLRLSPQSGPLMYGLALAWWEEGRRDDAIGKLRELAAIPPDDADSHLVLARALAAHGVAPGAVAEYERAMTSPTDAPAVAPMELAWLLATHPDPRFRDGDRAVVLAERASALGRELAARGGLALRSGLDARLARTLAAALAEKGRFDDAADVLRRSEGLFLVDGADRRSEIDDWLARFARREPIRAEPQFP